MQTLNTLLFSFSFYMNGIVYKDLIINQINPINTHNSNMENYALKLVNLPSHILKKVYLGMFNQTVSITA